MYIGLHNHSDHSNYRLRDSTNRVSDLIEYTHKLGHAGVAFTEHETVGSAVEVLNYMDSKKDQDEWKNYKIILGNEIYLTKRPSDDSKPTELYHFILLAKDAIGYQQICQLSTIAWMENSYTYVMQRVPTYYNNLKQVLSQNPGHIIGSTACLGGALPRKILEQYYLNSNNADYTQCIKWINQMVSIFGEGNFYLELQPSDNEEQIIVNKVLIQLSELTGVDYIVTTDAHYLRASDRDIHKAFLNSQEGDREVDSFYQTTYVMSEEELHQWLDPHIGCDKTQIAIDNTMTIYHKCENYDIRKPLSIPFIPDDHIEIPESLYIKYKDKCPSFEYFYHSEAESDRRLLYELLRAIEIRPQEFDNIKTYDEIEVNLKSIIISSEKMNTHWSAYVLQTSWIVKECWEAGTWVGPSRGSGGGFLLLYMLQITQINPLRETTKTYAWRFLNPERVSPLDVDIDIIGSDKDRVLQRLRDKYGDMHVSKVQTLLTEKAKSALLTACRGLGLSNDIGTFLTTFIKSERGLQFSLHDTFYGNENNNLAPDTEFVNLMTNEYPQVWEVAQAIEGLINGVGSHAGGVILTEKPFYQSTALMKTNTGDIITQFDLHAAESVGLIKWDLLAIDALGKMKVCLSLLSQDGLIEGDGKSQECYEKYLGIYNIERNEPKMWEMTWNREIMSLFQMEKQSGIQAISLVKPESVDDLAVINSVMRLMAPEEGAEPPLERFARFKADINLWYQEMTEYGLTPEEQKILEPYVKESYGLCESQEKFMRLVQDPAIGGFDLLWADRLRKSIAKKNPQAFEELTVEFYNNQKEKKLSEKLCKYTWDILISMNKGYGFNSAHTLAYSLIGLQEMNLAYNFPIIYWNTANLIVDSGGLDGSGTNYGKIARAIGNMQSAGVKINLVDINQSQYSFSPDVKTNSIIFGLNAILNVGEKVVQAIMQGRPYNSLEHFLARMEELKTTTEKLSVGKTAVVSLIKAGAFDNIESIDRVQVMKKYITMITNTVNQLSMSNINEIKDLGLLTQEQINNEYKFYKFREYVLQPKNFSGLQTGKGESTKFYVVEPVHAEPYFIRHFVDQMVENKDYLYNEQGQLVVKKGSFDRVYNNLTNSFRSTVLNNPQIIDAVNTQRIQQTWNELATGTISAWEMDSLCCYSHSHELANINLRKYSVSNFSDLPEEPIIIAQRNFRGKLFPRFELSRICGTVIDKNKDKHILTLLTPTGVVDVRFYKGQFTYYDQQLSEVDDDGKKTVIEKSWFRRGNKVFVSGYRKDDMFIAKKYKDSAYKHCVQLIYNIDKNNNISLKNERVGAEEYYE